MVLCISQIIHSHVTFIQDKNPTYYTSNYLNTWKSYQSTLICSPIFFLYTVYDVWLTRNSTGVSRSWFGVQPKGRQVAAEL